MKTLFLLRHAKSSWGDERLSDIDRPLNERGRVAAPFMGTLMKQHGYVPTVVLCSPAVRTRQTAELVKGAAGSAADIRFDGRIYEASAMDLRQVVSELDDTAETVMVVGHNPGCEGFLGYLTGQIEPMPTATLAAVLLDIDRWCKVTANTGKLIAIHRPRDEMR